MRRRVLLTLPALAGLLAAAPPVLAATAAPQVSVLARGLDNPRGLHLAPDGLLVAQAGRGGGAGPCIPNPEDPEHPACLGWTGRISHVPLAGGAVHDRVGGLPSLAPVSGPAVGGRAIGPSDVTRTAGGDLLATIGLGGDPSSDEARAARAAAPRIASLITVQPGLGRLTVADLGAYEIAQNPHPPMVDTNPNSVATGGGAQVVADAGANALLQVRRGFVSTVAVFPDRMVDAPPFLGLPPGTQIPMQAVPNSVVRGPDGAWYVGQLTGFPFPVGGASVWRVVPGEEPTVYASGFTNIVDLAFGRGGELLVLEIRHQGLLSPDRGGALLRVRPGGGGTPEVLLTDPLVEPGGLAVRGRTAYVSNRGTEAGTGEVLRIRF